MGITKESIERLKSTVDIVDVVGERVDLKKAGATWKGLCPFHEEKTPSFMVSSQRGSYHCFGCQAGGDVYAWVMAVEKLEFVEAVEWVAARYNFSLSYEQGHGERVDVSRTMEAVQGYYVEQLRDEDVKYLKSRGLKKATIREWGIGYAPRSAVQMKWLSAAGLNADDLVTTGIVRDGERGRYAHFADRVMFPVRDHRGKVVGWSGRSLREDAKAKYINSIDSRVFDKSRILFGWDRAKDAIYKKHAVVVMEGQMDVILSQQAGISTAVAAMGTALTERHLPMIRRAEARVILCYDGDKAGRAAAYKGAMLLSTHGFGGGVVLLPEGSDPADMVAAGRADKLKQMLLGAEDMVRWVLRSIVAGYRLEDPRQKSAAATACGEYLRSLGDAVVSAEYVPVAAAMVGVESAHILGDAPAVRPVIRPTGRASPEEVLIYTLYRHPEWIDTAVDLVDNDAWSDRERYAMLLSGQVDEAAFAPIALKDGIYEMSFEALESALRAKQKFFERRKR